MSVYYFSIHGIKSVSVPYSAGPQKATVRCCHSVVAISQNEVVCWCGNTFLQSFSARGRMQVKEQANGLKDLLPDNRDDRRCAAVDSDQVCFKAGE